MGSVRYFPFLTSIRQLQHRRHQLIASRKAKAFVKVLHHSNPGQMKLESMIVEDLIRGVVRIELFVPISSEVNRVHQQHNHVSELVAVIHDLGDHIPRLSSNPRVD